MKPIVLCVLLFFLAWCTQVSQTPIVDIQSSGDSLGMTGVSVERTDHNQDNWKWTIEWNLVDNTQELVFDLTEDESIIYDWAIDKYSEVELNLDTYSVLELPLFDSSTEWGNLEAYYDDSGDLVKLTATFMGELGQTTYEYYLSHGVVYFLFERTQHYNAPIYDESFDEDLTRITQWWHFFNNWKLFYWYNEEGKVIDNSDELVQLEETALERLDNLLIEVQ